MKFKNTIWKNDIKEFVDSNQWERSDVVGKIQDMKKDSMKRLISSLSEEKMKFINPNLIKWIEKEYFEILKKYDGEIDKNFDYTKTQKEIEKMFKKHKFKENYIWEFDNIKNNSLLETPIQKLKEKRNELIKLTNKQKRDYDEIKRDKQKLISIGWSWHTKY